MNLHEYQSKELFKKYGIAVPTGYVMDSADQADDIWQKLGGKGGVVKAQVHAGGRGKGGGVILAKNANDFKAATEKLLGTMLVTPQTDAKGLPINQVYAEPLSDIKKEYYLSLLIDRAARSIAIIASPEGGMSIEEVAEETPDLIFTEYVSTTVGLQGYQCRKLAFKLGLEGQQVKQFSKFLTALYKFFVDKDADLVEINPLITTQDGDLLALDAKVNLDGNALYRHPELVELRDITQEDEREAKAAKFDLNYISLDGEIGCMVNGAGLAMATMDVIKLEGGEPANFLDVGGGATAERVTEAFKIILSDSNVKAVLVNIFGGIVRCDLIAEGILEAIKVVNLNVPVVVRLEGTAAEAGRKLLSESDLAVIPAESLADGAKLAVAQAKGA